MLANSSIKHAYTAFGELPLAGMKIENWIKKVDQPWLNSSFLPIGWIGYLWLKVSFPKK